MFADSGGSVKYVQVRWLIQTLPWRQCEKSLLQVQYLFLGVQRRPWPACCTNAQSQQWRFFTGYYRKSDIDQGSGPTLSLLRRWLCCWFLLLCSSSLIVGVLWLVLVLLCSTSVYILVLQLSWRGRESMVPYFNCLPTFSVLWLFLTVTWVDLKCVIVVLPDHTRSLFMGQFMRARYLSHKQYQAGKDQTRLQICAVSSETLGIALKRRDVDDGSGPILWASSTNFGICRICEPWRIRRDCTFALYHQSLCKSH